MEITEFTFRLLLLFVPGLLSLLIVDKLTNHKTYKPHEVFIYTLLLGFIDYMALYAILNVLLVFWSEYHDLYFLQSLKDTKANLNFSELFFATLLAFPLGIFVSAAINRKWLFRLAYFLKVSRKFGYMAVGDYVMYLEAEGIEWVVVRDISKDLMYQGWAEAFSDSSEKKEIFLRDVIVYGESSGNKLYEVPGLYLNISDATVEFVGLKPTGDKKKQEGV
ncbi:MAG: hypothetical protein WCK75_11635 [Elusimicrobiota bacterium]